MILVFAIVLIFGFPAIAQKAFESGGATRLTAVTVAALTALGAFTLFSSSSAGGNRLAATNGYLLIVSRSILFYGFAVGLPVLTIAVVIGGLAKRIQHPGLLYAFAAGSGLAMFATGTILALFLLFG